MERRLLHIKLASVFIILTLAYLLKSIYSQGNSETLGWLLAPTAALVELFTGIPFVCEAGTGWVNYHHHVAIVPSCAGGNFLIILFCLLSLHCVYALRRMPSVKYLFPAIVLSLVFAYGATLLVNSARIRVSIILYGADIYKGWLTPELVHRVAGIVIYYLSLLGCYTLLLMFLQKRAGQGAGSFRLLNGGVLLVPLLCYLLFTVGVPLVRSTGIRDPEQFVYHALTVVGVSVGCTVVLLLGRCLFRQLMGRQVPR